tara:strand:- start:1054 stop:1479 length:426 start_codon:yes stop_codon:yes gene_type:complete
MISKKLFITGGAGFIGSAVIRHIINNTKHSTYVLLEEARDCWSSIEGDKKDVFRFHHVSTDEVYGGLTGLRGYDYDSDHKKFYSKEELVVLLESHGYINEKIFGMPLNVDWLSDKVRQYCIYGRFINFFLRQNLCQIYLYL